MEELFVPHAFTQGNFAESLLTTLNQHLNSFAEQLRREPRAANNIEIECRFGSIDHETKNFIPGIPQEVFHGMKDYLKKRVVKGQWMQGELDAESPHNVKVTAKESDVIDILFEDNIRLTVRIYFGDERLTKIKDIKLIEAIRKHKIDNELMERTFAVRNLDKKQCFDIRISSANEENLLGLKNGDESYRDHFKYAKDLIMKSYSASPKDKILGNVIVSFAPQSSSKDFLLTAINVDDNIHFNNYNDPLWKYASEQMKQFGKPCAKKAFIEQLSWTLLLPNELPSLQGRDNVHLHNIQDIKPDQLVYLSNLPGRIKFTEHDYYAVSCSEYILTCKYNLLIPTHSKFAQKNNPDASGENHELRIVYFRRKQRVSFALRDNISLDLTIIQQSMNPSTISSETPSFELELEALLSFPGEKEFAHRVERNDYAAVELCKRMIKDLSSYVYGIKLVEPNEIFAEQEIWKNAAKNDQIRYSMFHAIFGAQSQPMEIAQQEQIGKVFPRKRRPSDVAKPFVEDDENNNSESKKRKTAQEAATEFYNQLDRSNEDRSSSWIYHMRCFNNFARSILFSEYLKNLSNDIEILDLACGKGSDLFKFIRTIDDLNRSHKSKTKIKNYVGVDIALQSIRDFVERVNGNKKKKFNKKPNFAITLVEADLGGDYVISPEDNNAILNSFDYSPEKACFDDEEIPFDSTALFSGDPQFDFISMQFALHYLFETEEKANGFFRFISRKLKTNGVFVATTVDCNRLIEHLMKSGPGENSIHIYDKSNSTSLRSICEISFDPSVRNQLLGKQTKLKKLKNNFGLKYTFTLKDRDSNAVDAPEWLVVPTELFCLARKHGLNMVLYSPLVKFALEKTFQNNNYTYIQLMQNMNVINAKGEIPQVDFEIASLYVAVAFVKLAPDEKSNNNIMQLLKEMQSVIPNFEQLPSATRSQLVNSLSQELKKDLL